MWYLYLGVLKCVWELVRGVHSRQTGTHWCIENSSKLHHHYLHKGRTGKTRGTGTQFFVENVVQNLFKMMMTLVERKSRWWFQFPSMSVFVRKIMGKSPENAGAPFTQDAQILRTNPLMLLATCVNTPIYCSVFHICMCVLQGAPHPV